MAVSLVEVQRVAIALFARQGFAATGIREVGREVGLSSAALYHYAPTKQDLLAGVMAQCLAALDDAAAVASEAIDPAQRLARLVAVHVGLSAVNPATCRVTDEEVRSLTESNLSAVLTVRDRYEARWAATLRDGSSAGVFAVVDARLTRLALLDMCSGVAAWYRQSGPAGIKEIQLQFAELALRLVGAELPADLPAWVDIDVPHLSSEPLADRSAHPERNAS